MFGVGIGRRAASLVAGVFVPVSRAASVACRPVEAAGACAGVEGGLAAGARFDRGASDGAGCSMPSMIGFSTDRQLSSVVSHASAVPVTMKKTIAERPLEPLRDA